VVKSWVNGTKVPVHVSVLLLCPLQDPPVSAVYEVTLLLQPDDEGQTAKVVDWNQVSS
jgi:hypothetical protein